MCEPRFMDHQLYLNGQRVLEGRNDDYVVVDSRLPAFNFIIKGNDYIVWTETHGVGVEEYRLDPKKVHRLCPKCQANSKPQPEAAGEYHTGYLREVCSSCTIELLEEAIRAERAVLDKRLAQLAKYRRFRDLVGPRGKLRDGEMQEIFSLLDAHTKINDLVQSTTDLVERTKKNIDGMGAALESLVRDGDC